MYGLLFVNIARLAQYSWCRNDREKLLKIQVRTTTRKIDINGMFTGSMQLIPHVIFVASMLFQQYDLKLIQKTKSEVLIINKPKLEERQCCYQKTT